MAKKKKKQPRQPKQEKRNREPLLHPDTFDSIVAIVAFLGALLFILAKFGTAGKVGAWTSTLFTWLLGGGYFLLPIVMVLFGCTVLLSLKDHVVRSSVIGATLLLIASLAFADVAIGSRTGGIIGAYAAAPFTYLFDRTLSLIIFSAVILIGCLILFNTSLRRKRLLDDEEEEDDMPEEVMPAAAIQQAKEEVMSSEPHFAPTPPPQPKKIEKKDPTRTIAPELLAKVTQGAKDYKLPPLELLSTDQGKPSGGDIKANANIIQRALQDFGIPVEMAGINVGPSVTQYTLKPAQGVRLSRIVALHNDLALALAAHPLRIEAPIPGQSLVGVEVPNRSVALVGLRNMLDNEEYQKGGPLMFALGRDVSGKAAYADLARMPHMLVAGATGSGKSVAVHTILMSLLYKNTPLSLRLILIDPKRVEMTHYHDIPHLIAPVITSSKDAISALRWTVKEMEERYKILEGAKRRDIVSFNSAGGDFMPYIVVVIDELADLMMSFGREVESSIVRIAQMARAVGIHLILSTQRPSVEVITGLIKANITSRVAFQVASQIDSRTILDMAGAEKLLGSGDMLYLAGDTGKPRRIQGGFVSESEVKKVSEFVREQDMEVIYNEEVTQMKGSSNGHGSSGEDEVDEEDPLFEDAYRVIVESGRASTSYLQRRLKLGYNRAARLMDYMEQKGIVGPQDGSKVREILVPHDGTGGDEDDANEFD